MRVSARFSVISVNSIIPCIPIRSVLPGERVPRTATVDKSSEDHVVERKVPAVSLRARLFERVPR